MFKRIPTTTLSHTRYTPLFGVIISIEWLVSIDALKGKILFETKKKNPTGGCLDDEVIRAVEQKYCIVSDYAMQFRGGRQEKIDFFSTFFSVESNKNLTTNTLYVVQTNSKQTIVVVWNDWSDCDRSISLGGKRRLESDWIFTSQICLV